MRYSLRFLLGSTLAVALLWNPLKYFYNTVVFQKCLEQFCSVFYNVNLCFASIMLDFDPEYMTIHRGDYFHVIIPLLLAGLISLLLWIAIIAILIAIVREVFGYETFLRAIYADIRDWHQKRKDRKRLEKYWRDQKNEV